MKLLSTLIAVLVLNSQAHAFNHQAPFKFKGQKALTVEGKAVHASDMFTLLKKQKARFSAKLARADWEGVYSFKVTADEGGESINVKIPVLSSEGFPGSPYKGFANFLLTMPVGVVLDNNSYATSMIPYVLTAGKDGESTDLYVGVEDFGFFYYRLNLGKDQKGAIYLVETLSGEPKETKIASLELTSFETKASLNLEVSTYDYEIKTDEAKKFSAKSDQCGGSFKGEMGFVKFPQSVAVTPTGYAWQNVATDGGKCSLYFGGSPVGPRAGTLKVENPGYLGCQKQDGDGNQESILCGIGLASELQFQGVPSETNLIMKLYLTRVYQYEVAASINLIAR